MDISLERKVCEICGGDGFEEVLVTCSKCRISTEHVYCFRKNLIEIPDEWFCEDCEQDKLQGDENSLNLSGNGETQKEIAKINDSDHKRKKAVPTGKVKFIDAEEVIRLSSGGKKFGSPSKTNLGFRYSNSTCASPKSSPLKAKPNPKGLISVEPFVHKRNQINSMPSQQANRTSKEKRVTFHLMTGNSCKKQKNEKVKAVKTCSVNSLLKETEKPDATFVIRKQNTSDRKADDVTNTSLGASPTTVHHFPIVGTSNDPVVGSIDPVTEVEVLNTMPIHNAFSSYFPAEEEIWKGGFKFPDTVMPGTFYGGFKAHPPCIVSRKAYEFSSTMPIVLQVMLLPQDLVWGYLSQNDDPDLRDIAFYLFPSPNIERSQETYSIVFKLLETENSAMISCIGDVELLIFTSKQLNPNSLDVAQKVIGEHFLWATFRHSKDKIPQKCSSPIDMEVDMEGGQPIGRVDIVVSQKSKTDKECSHNKLSSAFESSFQQIRLDIRKDSDQLAFLFSEAENALSSYHTQNSVKSWQELDIPPGFESYK